MSPQHTAAFGHRYCLENAYARRAHSVTAKLRSFACVSLSPLAPQDIEHQRVAYEAKKAEGDADWAAPKLVGRGQALPAFAVPRTGHACGA